MAGIIITKVVRQVENVIISRLTDRGLTLGAIVDEHIEAALANGDEVQTVAVEMEQSEWDTLRKMRCDAHGMSQAYDDRAVAKPKKR